MVELVCPKGTNTDGAYRLEWQGGVEGARFLLQENGEVLYQGKDLATTVTGRQQGTYAYELSEVGSGGSARCEVVVEPHSLGAAFGLFGVGAVVFLSTLVVVVIGHRAHRAGRIG